MNTLCHTLLFHVSLFEAGVCQILHVGRCNNESSLVSVSYTLGMSQALSKALGQSCKAVTIFTLPILQMRKLKNQDKVTYPRTQAV